LEKFHVQYNEDETRWVTVKPYNDKKHHESESKSSPFTIPCLLNSYNTVAKTSTNTVVVTY